MATDKELLACFNMPSGQTITGRSSSIRNVFVAAIVPIVHPTPAEIEKVVEILGLNPNDVNCAYCGDKATEWDHLRPLVDGGRPTGYPSSIRNLVPACGKCNQSKGKSDWRIWMRGKAKLSPAARGRVDLENRIERLEEYEAWAKCQRLDIERLVDPDKWKEYYALQDEILSRMRAAQNIADLLRKQILIASEMSEVAQ